MAAEPITLTAPDGRAYTTNDRVEATNLKARGYKVKADRPKAAQKPDK